jgi:hypothetical protein
MLQTLLRRLIRWFRGSPPSPDPHAYVREPVRRRPGGGASAVAVEEPPAPSDVHASGAGAVRIGTRAARRAPSRRRA